MDGQSRDAAREGDTQDEAGLSRPKVAKQDTQESGESYIPDKTLYMVARRLGPGWKKLALVELGFSVIQVQTIETNHPKDTERQGLDMLSKWKQAQPIGSEQQMTTLRAALENIGRADICQESSISDETLYIVARSLGRGWVRLAVEELGFTVIQVQTIETDYPNDIERQGLDMLAQWKQAQPTSFEQQITTLRAALEKIGRADIFLKFPTVSIETNTPLTDMKTVRTTRNWDGQVYTRHQVSAFAALFDGVLEQVNDGSVIFVVRIMSREGLNKLWSMYTTGELAKKLTEILITDELKTEDKSDFAIQATIPKSDYDQACGFFDELEKDQRKEFPTVSIETDASWKRTKTFRATGYPRMDTAHSYDWEGQDYTRHQVSAVIESCNGVLEQGNPGSETFVVRIMSREGLDKLWRMYTTGELAKKLTEFLITDERTIQSTIPESNYNQACGFFDKLEKDQRKDEECSIGMTDVEHKELGESSPAKMASSSNPAEHPVKRSAENIERLHTTTDGDDSSSMMEVEHKQLRKSSQATTSYSSDPAEHSEARWTNREVILHTITAPHQKLPKCHCDNNKPLKYRPYYSKGEDGGSRLLGICCTNCGQEWLEGRFLFHPDEDNTRPSVKLRSVLLKKQLEVPTESNPAFQVKGSPTKIENFKFLCDYLKPGDHITWRRHWGYWHHAIVSEIGGVGERVEVIQWCKSGCGVIKVIKKWLELSQEEGELYRIDYEKTITEVNTPELVIARARSRLHDTGYDLFSDNCEAFASYCKTGLAESWQIVWLYQKVKSVVMEALTNAITGFAKVSFTIVAKEYAKEGAKAFLEQGTRAAATKVVETLERLARETDAVGAGIIIFFEGCACLYNLDQIYENRKKGDISRQDFIASAFKRVSEAVLGARLAVGGGIAGGKLAGAAAGTLFMPGLGTAVGAFIGSIVRGVIGSMLGRCFGVSVGSPIGCALAITIGTNDRAVKNIRDLNPGDQVVFFGNLLHPRHHAIVVDCDPLKGKVRVVHNTYQNGVVEELVDFSKPVYRLEYDKECYPPDEVIKRARSKIGDETYKYSLAFNNCKSFGRWCKVK